MQSLDDTIAAISTPVGEGGIGIVRLSGRRALSIADKIFKSKNGKAPSEFKSYTTHYGHVIGRQGGTNCEIIDEVILTVMRAPKSYTKEDIVEINCHSGIVPLRKILERTLSLGARLAEPGEFTKRAFLNGRIDLTQAESVLGIISSKTEASLRAAMSQLGGEFSEEIKKLRNRLIDLCGDVEASIDFPEEDIEALSGRSLKEGIRGIIEKLKTLIDSADKGRILAEGIRTVICGRTNVGKSSLMNAFLREKRVIVSHIPGTTRDAIEEIISIDGIPLRNIDTAGIIDSDDLLTKEGVEKSRLYIKAADLVLFLLDGSEPLTDNDKIITDEIRDKKVIVVINKTDLPRRLNADEVKMVFRGKRIIELSLIGKRNLRELERAICEIFWRGGITSDHTPLVTNARHKRLLIRAESALKKALRGLERRVHPEFIALDIKEGINFLGEVTGETLDSKILDRIFDKFCIGK